MIGCKIFTALFWDRIFLIGYVSLFYRMFSMLVENSVIIYHT